MEPPDQSHFVRPPGIVRAIEATLYARRGVQYALGFVHWRVRVASAVVGYGSSQDFGEQRQAN